MQFYTSIPTPPPTPQSHGLFGVEPSSDEAPQDKKKNQHRLLREEEAD